MKAFEISEDTLEDLLSYDDHFLDYFNAFLQLPAFSEPLEYDRLTGTFSQVGVENHLEKRYGVSDEHRESLLEWCKTHRLPFFLETDLFRELKLVKLLLRKVEDRFQSSASRKSSSAIRGYSRQTESYVSSLSNSADNSANEDDYDEDQWTDKTTDDREDGDRPMSRAYSLPARHKDDSVQMLSPQKALRDKKVLFAGKTSETEHTDISINLPAQSDTKQQPSHKPVIPAIVEEMADIKVPDHSEISSQSAARSISAPVNYRDFLKLPMYTDFSDIFLGYEPAMDEEEYVAYNEDKVSDQQTESDLKNLEGKVNMSLHQIKEKIFSTRKGMEEFREFLSDEGCTGIHLLNFWLDCERFKDILADEDEVNKMVVRNRIFRDIQDKYKMSLTTDAKEQIRKAASCYHLSHNVFIRTQYDVLRRLRAYWLPRFILHKEKANQLSSLISAAGQEKDGSDAISTSFLPKISFVSSLPIHHEQIIHATSTSKSWHDVMQFGRKFDARIKSAASFKSYHTAFSDSIKDRMIHSLLHDGQAGCPFHAYLSKFEKQELVNKLNCWQALTEYEISKQRDADRLLLMNLSWSIYNQHVQRNSPAFIGVGDQTQNDILRNLHESTDLVPMDVFRPIKSVCESSLVSPWTLFIKNDVKMFLDAQARQFNEGFDRPVFTLDSIHLYCDPDSERAIISKPLLQPRVPTASSITTVKIVKKNKLTKSARHRRREDYIELRRQLRKEQKALLKAVKQREEQSRQRIVDLNAKSRASGTVDGQAEGENPDGFDERLFANSGKSRSNQSRFSMTKDGRFSSHTRVDEERDVELIDVITNRPMMVLFKRYLTSNDAREFIHGLLLYNEIDVYHRTESKPKSKKDIQANFLYKTYMDRNSKKAVTLNDKIYGRLANEKDRPKSSTMNETQKYLLQYIGPMFKQFFEAQAEEFGLEPKALAQMSQAELSLRADTDASLQKQFSNVKKGAGKGKKRSIQYDIMPLDLDFDLEEMEFGFGVSLLEMGRAPPSKEDKQTFMQNFQELQHKGILTAALKYFWKYLVKHGDEENNPLIDKDLLFYIEVLKYKDLYHSYNDEELVKKKCQAIVDVFLESSISPSCQIDISSDMCSRLIKNAVKVMQGKEMVANIFDEAVFIVFKELLPYWAGFMKTYEPPEDPTAKPVSKHQKALQERYDEFIKSEPPPEEKIRVLPQLKGGPNNQPIKISSLTYSMVEGLRVKSDNHMVAF